MNEARPQYSQNLCNSLEVNHFEDDDVKKLFYGGFTSSRLLKAAHLIRQKENSPLLKLNLDIKPSEEVDNIENLPEVLRIACSSGTMQVTLDCIENAATESVMLKVQAPFSALMMLIGSNRTFKWICSYPQEMHHALRELTEKTASFCIEAISKGTPIISLADPSGMLELLGEKRYREFCAFYVLLLLRKLYPSLDKSVVHICPRTSLILEQLQLLRAEVDHYEGENYANAVLQYAEQSENRILGHRCINAEYAADNRIYILTMNDPVVSIRSMTEKDWDSVSRIYNEGIQSKKATIVKELPDKEQWLSAHRKCLVAEYLGNIIGFAALNNNAIPEISVYIEKDFQSLGVGTMLLRKLQSQTGGKIRSLIFENNIPSIRLHEKRGFRRVDAFRFEGDSRQVLVYEWEVPHERLI